MAHSDDNEKIHRQTQKALNLGIKDPDKQELEQLAEVRLKALDLATQQKPIKKPLWNLQSAFISAGLCATLLIGILFITMPNPTGQSGLADASIEDIEVIMADVDIELLELDAEFYQWVADTEDQDIPNDV